MGTHAHDHDHSHHQAPQSFNLAFALAISITLAYVVGETIYGFAANSMSLLADAVHNLGDVLGLILAWIANWLLSLPASKRYSYGFKRTTIFASLINAFILVGTSVLIAYESIYKLFHVTTVDEPIVVVVGIIGIVVNGGCALLFMRGSKGDLNIRSAFWHLLADMLILVGVVVSAIIIYFTGWMWIDPVVGIAIVAIVLWGTWGLLRDSTHLMLDAIPHYVDHIGVKQYLTQYPGVNAVHDLHIWGLSTREIALTAHLIMPHTPLTDVDHKKINHDLLHHFNINHVTIQVETGDMEDPCVRHEKC